MWRITADLLPNEVEHGATFGYNQARGEIIQIQTEGVADLKLTQSNNTMTGYVKCIV